ncbi:hypothetical protein K438DRAFT_725275 [Mycena galopus ATCC 62051]|nr:hypothetical protein K438DRAFT_725275 [Mycena galopus ATCC 62051]
MSAQEAPLLLCRICSTWRTIALSMPRLWATLHVPSDYILAKEPRQRAVIEWLQRSAACPISFSVSWLEHWAWGSSSYLPVLKSLGSFSARWRHVELTRLPSHLDLDDGLYSRPLWVNELAQIRAPALESFKYTGILRLLCDLDIFKLPGLRIVTLHSQGRGHLDFVLTMPLVWDQLTHLTLDCELPGRGLFLHDVFVLLARCTRLISFRASFQETVPPTDTRESTLLPFLETFILTDDSLKPPSLLKLIENLSMPQLRRFHVEVEAEPGTTFPLVTLGTMSPLIEELGTMLLSFFINLECLEDENTWDFPAENLTTEPFAETLRSLSSLTKLVVCDNSDESDLPQLSQLLELLTPGANPEGTLCPALQELVIERCGDPDRSKLDAFIQRRMEFARGFRRLEIRNPWSRELLPESQIQSYRSQGLDISVICTEYWCMPAEPPSPWTGLLQDDSESKQVT